MNPQGALPVNVETFAKLRKQIETVDSCEQLQDIAGDAIASVNGVISGINEQLAAIQPILALMTAPGANPAQIVTWITSFIKAFIAPYAKPAMALPIQVAALAKEVAALNAAIETAAGRIGSCTVPLPSVSIPEIPDLPAAKVG